MISTLLVTALAASPWQNYQETASYDLQAELLPGSQTVHGSGTVRWTNRGKSPVRQVYWHMYLNAFANDRSAFMRETSGGALRSDEFDGEGWGYIELVALDLLSGGANTPLTFKTQVVAPDASSPHDRTVMVTTLPAAVQPGQTIVFDMRFVSKLPTIFARTGYADDFFFVAQWFPKLGVLEDNHGASTQPKRDSRGYGRWNAHPFHGFTEFFADYGRYKVAITAPSDFVIAASGSRTSERDLGDGRRTVVHEQDAVHDFAFVADRRMQRHVRIFDPRKHVDPVRLVEVAALLGRSPAEIQLSPVEVAVYIQPEHEPWLERYFDALFVGLRELGLHYGAYPYPVLSLIDGPENARGAMGMEYPTLIAGGVGWPAPEDGTSPENVTIHELAHQWFYGLVGSNEVEHPWLDEGLTTYATSKVVDREYGQRIIAIRAGEIPLLQIARAFPLTRFDIGRAGVRLNSGRNAIDQPGHTQQDRTAYSLNAYLRPALSLRQFEIEIGRANVARALRRYVDGWRFRHPRPPQLLQALEQQAGRSLKRPYQAAFEAMGTIDYGISKLTTRRSQTVLGLDFESLKGGKAKFHTEAKPTDNGEWVSEVEIERLGSVSWPLQVELRFTDGATVSQSWDGEAGFTRVQVSYEHPVESARLYPNQPQLLDVRPMNDSRSVDGSMLPGLSWGSRALGFVQALLQFAGAWL